MAIAPASSPSRPLSQDDPSRRLFHHASPRAVATAKRLSRLPSARCRLIRVPLLSATKVALAVAVISAAAFNAGVAALWALGNEFEISRSIEKFGNGIGLSHLRISGAAVFIGAGILSCLWVLLVAASALLVTASFNAAARCFGGIAIDIELPPTGEQTEHGARSCEPLTLDLSTDGDGPTSSSRKHLR
jgi:hypothetical protein